MNSKSNVDSKVIWLSSGRCTSKRPVVAGPSSERGIERLRREINALQADAGIRISHGYGAEAVPAEPAHSESYSLEELKAMVPDGGLQCAVC